MVLGALVTGGLFFSGFEAYQSYTKGGKQHVGHEDIERAYREYVSQQKGSFRKFKSRCDWLKENAARFDRSMLKATARKWGCRYRFEVLAD